MAHQRLFVPRRPGFVDALDPATGRLLWRHSLGTRINTSVAATAAGIVVGTLDGRLRLLKAESGQEIANYELGGIPYGDLLVSADCVVVLWAEGVEGNRAERYVVGCLEPSLKQLRWRHASDSEWTTDRPLVIGGELIVGRVGSLVALNLADGTPVWTCTVEGVPRGPGYSGTVLYVGTLSGRVTALRLDSSRSQRHPLGAPQRAQ